MNPFKKASDMIKWFVRRRQDAKRRRELADMLRDGEQTGWRYRFAIAIMERMPPTAIERLHTNLRGVRWHASPEALTHWCLKADLTIRGKSVQAFLDAGDRFLGMWSWGGSSINRGDLQPIECSFRGHLHLTGTEDVDHSERTFAHEYSHAIDGIDGSKQLSQSRQWRSVWTDEFQHGQLTREASRSQSEGFAEFGSLVYTKGAERFPKAMAFWNYHKLLPKGTKL
jgi:hypothetical protein